MVSSAVYRYFPSRDDLLTALLIAAYDELGAAAEAADDAVADRDDVPRPVDGRLPRDPRVGGRAPPRLRPALRLPRAGLRRAAGHRRPGDPGRRPTDRDHRGCARGWRPGARRSATAPAGVRRRPSRAPSSSSRDLGVPSSGDRPGDRGPHDHGVDDDLRHALVRAVGPPRRIGQRPRRVLRPGRRPTCRRTSGLPPEHARREQCLTVRMRLCTLASGFNGPEPQNATARTPMPRITRKTFVAAPADVVWQLAGDFAEWHPKLRIYADGPEASPELVVTVVDRDDAGMTLSYHMPDPPFPIANHRATILVEDAGALVRVRHVVGRVHRRAGAAAAARGRPRRRRVLPGARSSSRTDARRTHRLPSQRRAGLTAQLCQSRKPMTISRI